MLDLPIPDQLLLRSAGFAQDVAAELRQDDVDWSWTPDGSEWNLTQVICHLRDVELEVHQPRFRALIERDGAFIQGVDADKWAGPRRYHLQNGPEALATFLIARADTIDLLVDVSPPHWLRTGQHAFFGLTTMHELLEVAVRHDEAHWKQIMRLRQRNRG